jgi:5'-nucleotidase / UDP-sugar diphosphatase
MTEFSRRQTLAALLATSTAIADPRARAAALSATRLSFLHVNDVYRIDEDTDRRGGMARYAAVVKAERERARAQNRTLICTHAGDTLSPSLMSSFDQGAHMIDLFNAAGLNIFVPGNHEFDFGKDIYFERMREARFAILAANLKDRDGAALPLHKESLVLEADGIKLAVMGPLMKIRQPLRALATCSFCQLFRRLPRMPKRHARRARISLSR